MRNSPIQDQVFKLIKKHPGLTCWQLAKKDIGWQKKHLINAGITNIHVRYRCSQFSSAVNKLLKKEMIEQALGIGPKEGRTFKINEYYFMEKHIIDAGAE